MLPFARIGSFRAIRCKHSSFLSQSRTLNQKKILHNTQKTFHHTSWQQPKYHIRLFHSTRAQWDDQGSKQKSEQEEEKKSNQQDKKTEREDKKDGFDELSGKKDKKKNSDSNDEDRQFWSKMGFITAGSLICLTLLNYWVDSVPTGNQIDWYTFKTKFLSTGKVEKVVVYTNTNQVMVTVKDSNAPGGTKHYYFTIGDVNTFEKHMHQAQQLLGIHSNDYVPILYTKNLAHDAINFSWSVLPLVAAIGITFLVFKRISGPMGGGGGPGGMFSFGKSTAKKYSKQTKVPITFKQVAGMKETKQEVMEFVDFLKSPAKYKKLGAKTPKGALLVGPPGTGKTLLAKATAGEAGVPFYSISGSEFVEMFVGVGSARVRDLFEEARADAPCIIFIDEIDAIGRARSKSSFANDERENTLNQLLVEMDGFNTEAGVVVLAGTNRPDILDNALLRPGRFDRQIYIDNPDIKGRKEIFEVHLKPLKLEKAVEDYAKPLAAITPGFSGADIANVCNEGALIAARYNKTAVDMHDLEAAIERVIGGMERKNRVLSPDEKKTVAYHEAGHATVGWFLEHANPLLKVSIVPRGIAALGYAMYQPKDQHMYSREQLIDMMCVSLGGRIAEWLIFGRITTGASDDLDKVTKMAYSQIMQLGMSSALGPVSFQQPKEGEIVLEKPYSEATARLIDKEVRALVDIAYQKTEKILIEKRELLEKLALVLLEKEVIKREDMVAILGPRPWGEETTYEQITGETSPSL